MASNFLFLKEEWSRIYEYARLAEKRIRTEPTSAGQYARLALEATVHQIYDLENLWSDAAFTEYASL